MSESPNITMEAVVSRIENKFLISNLGDEMVLMDIQEGHYINVNPVGRFIWNHLTTPVAVKDLVYSLTETYDISVGQCETETLNFLQKMRQHNMLQVQ